jgi:hypothetical protein
MVRLLFILVFMTTMLNGQTILENFDSTSNWTFTNGAGIQEYPNNNYASTNINDLPYINDTLITITSPIYQFECENVLVVEFPLFGRIEESDTLFFQYLDNDEWLTKDWYTGIKDITPSYNFNPTVSQFRFVLKTDTSKLDSAEINGTIVEYDASNSYVGRLDTRRQILVYFYDIDFFKIECSTPLSISLTSFTGAPYANYNQLEWITATQTNNQWFRLSTSSDALKWSIIDYIAGEGNSNNIIEYVYRHYQPTGIYYLLESIDGNGYVTSSDIIVINRKPGSTLLKIINLAGQPVTPDYQGIVIYVYSDGSVMKVFRNFSY